MDLRGRAASPRSGPRAGALNQTRPARATGAAAGQRVFHRHVAREEFKARSAGELRQRRARRIRGMRAGFAAVRDDARALCDCLAGGPRVDALAAPIDQDLIEGRVVWSPSCRVSRIESGLRVSEEHQQHPLEAKELLGNKPF